MSSIKKFIHDYTDELINKVHWPKLEELQIKTVIVIVASVVFAIMIGMADLLFNVTMRFIYDNL